MKINWKARLKNKVFVIVIATLIVSVIYQILGLFGIVPAVSKGAILNVIELIVKMLVALGVLVDPTTDGIKDSDRAMTYGTDADVRFDEIIYPLSVDEGEGKGGDENGIS